MAEPRTLLLVAAVMLALAGCTTDTPNPSSPAERTTMSAPAVRTDGGPITKRFPELGDFLEAHWQGSAAGIDSDRIPGPTDIRIQALVVLNPQTASATSARYQWTPAPAGWDASVSAELRPFLPSGAVWQASEQFGNDVRTPRYNGPVYFDSASGTVYLNVIG